MRVGRVVGCLWWCAVLLAPRVTNGESSPTRWHISGMFTEACSCAPPCGCNFGQAPSPHDFCYTVFSYGIKTGEYDGVSLDGLTITCAKGQAGRVWYLDRKSTPAQMAALRAIANRILPVQDFRKGADGRFAKAMVPATLTHEVTDRGSRVQIEGAGGFDNRFLMGLDGKTPIVVLNNATFNLKRSLKGQTGSFRYKDGFGNQFDFHGTNTNTGEFEYDQDTKRFIQ
jgi:hypothetical protein